MTDLEMIGEIRQMLPQLWDGGKFELSKEIMGGIDYHNFAGIPSEVVRRIWLDLCDATHRLPGDRLINRPLHPADKNSYGPTSKFEVEKDARGQLTDKGMIEFMP
jgi:hypothetical protein